MSPEAGARPVLALLSASQVPLIGPVSALRGLKAGVDTALRLAVCQGVNDVLAFESMVRAVRCCDLYDTSFSRAFASGYTLTADEIRRIGGSL